MTVMNSATNPWSNDDEKEHPNSPLEWWCVEAFFTKKGEKKTFSFKGSLVEWDTKNPKRTGSVCEIALYDPYKDNILSDDVRDDTHRLISSSDTFNIQFNESYFRGKYPNYQIHFKSKKHEIILTIDFSATTSPHWVAQEITDGWLPQGLGFYRYGFIPRGKILGSVTIQNETFPIEGEAYFEHIWGDFTYRKLADNWRGLKKSFRIYTKLAQQWLHDHKITIPKTIMFCTENNPLGYDWVWALFNNGWSLFYGNIMLWLMRGPAAGTIILNKDKTVYEEFYNVSFRYNEIKYSKHFDFCFPSDMELSAVKGDKKILVRCNMMVQPREYISRFDKGKYWLGLIICEAHGTIQGYYEEKGEKINLTGICKMEPQRQVTILGNNIVRIDFHLPPKDFGVTFDFFSTYFKKHVNVSFKLTPRLKISLKMQKLQGEWKGNSKIIEK